MKKIFILLALLLFAVNAWCATAYVDFTNGSDSNAGTEALPFKHCPCSSLDTALSNTFCTNLAAGDTIYLKRGEVWENTTITFSANGSSGNEITVTDYGDSSDAAPIISANTYYSSGDFTGPDGNGEYYVGSISSDPNKVWDSDALVTEGTVGSLAVGEWGYDSGNSRVYFKPSGSLDNYNINVPTQQRPFYLTGNYYIVSDLTAEGGYHTSAGTFYLNNSDNGAYTNLTLKKPITYNFRLLGGSADNTLTSLDIYPYGATGIRIDSGGDDNTIDSCTITNPDTGMDIDDVDGTTVTGCTVQNPDGLGTHPIVMILVDGTADNTTLTNNIVKDSEAANSVGIRTNGTTTITGGTVTNIAGTGIDVASDAATITNVTISDIWNDLAYGSGGTGKGIHVEDGADATISRCSFLNNYIGFEGGTHNTYITMCLFRDSLVNTIEAKTVDPETTLIYNNTIYHNPDPDVITDNGHGIMFRTGGSTLKGEIKNNIIYMTCRMDGVDGVQIDDTADDVTLSNNRYYADNPDTYSVNLLYYNSTNYDSNFSGWETATGDSDSAIEFPDKTSVMDNGVAISTYNDRDDLDINGKYPYGPVDIGAKQTWGVSSIQQVETVGTLSIQ